jgi:hypothetical protein
VKEDPTQEKNLNTDCWLLLVTETFKRLVLVFEVALRILDVCNNRRRCIKLQSNSGSDARWSRHHRLATSSSSTTGPATLEASMMYSSDP